MGNCCAISARPSSCKLARELCDQYGVLLIIDEVKTGFRVARGGVQSLIGVTPDISTFAKAMANGYPIAAIGGREEVMRTFRFGGAAHGGTYTAHSVSLAAAEKCLEILDETDALAAHRRLRRAAEGRHQGDPRPRAASCIPSPATRRCSACSSPPSRPTTTATGSARTIPSTTRWPVTCTTAASSASPTRASRWFMCAAHDAACLADTLRAFETAVDRTLEQVEAEKRA